MKILLWSVGKAHEPYVKAGIELFTKRISHYFSVEWQLIAPPKNVATLTADELKKAEAQIISRMLLPEYILIVLDEKGLQMSSEQLAGLIRQKTNESTRTIIFLIGGAYGLHESVIKRANIKWSLSTLVFPHQLVRLILAEQIYRACTIIRNEKYHHS
ncbi:MAG: 23S rRNA (pseudouridine(1915)-N(3))-methyltransferase RlmH [Ginsengibacter sp.]